MPVINTNYSFNFYNQRDLYAKNNINPETFAAFNYLYSPLPSTSGVKEYFTSKKEKLTVKEGANLFFKGVKGRIKELANEIREHPIRTAIMVTGTMTALSLLPTIGLTVGTGSAILAAAFAIKTGINIVKDLVNIKKFRKSGDNYMLRKYIKKLGSDSFDMALVAPPIPKGVMQLKRQITAGQAFKVNKELIGALKTSKKVTLKAEKLVSANINMMSKQLAGKLPWQLRVFKRFQLFKSHINKIQDIFHTVTSLYSSLYSSFSTGLILAKRAKEFGIDDEYCQKAGKIAKETLVNQSITGRISSIFNQKVDKN